MTTDYTYHLDSPPIWKIGNSDSGITPSERYLGVLARKAFLSFWSFQNPYTDESGGRELCDLLVVFGNDVIIFSDKHCNFSSTHAVGVAWQRWFKSAIEKSSRQLIGAASFIEKHPHRVFLDSACNHRLPLPLPPPAQLRLHLVAVTRGCVPAAERHWGNNSSGSLMINTQLQSQDHRANPFMVGWPLGRQRFIHVFDELTLDVLLGELDTAADLIKYLHKKEEYLSQPGRDFIISGEEDLLASYLLTDEKSETKPFEFPKVADGTKLVVFAEGEWARFRASSAYSQWKAITKSSYVWDELIEHQTSHIQNATAKVLIRVDKTSGDVRAHEEVLRAMAQEGRISRRFLAEGLIAALTRQFDGDRFARTLVLPTRPDRAYVFMVLRKNPATNEEDYREIRRASLVGYCRAARLRISNLREVVGIATDQHEFQQSTQDFLLFQFLTPLDEREKQAEIVALRRGGIWRDEWRHV